MGSCQFSCPAAILGCWEKAELSSNAEAEENGEGGNGKELGKNSQTAWASVNSCVARMKSCRKEDPIRKLCVWVFEGMYL